MYTNLNNPVNYQLQGFGQNGVRTISTDQLYIQGEYYRVLVAEEDSYVTAVSVLGDDLTAEFVYAGTTIYGLFTEVSVSSGSLTAYIAGPTDIEDVWAYINEYGLANAATIEAADCAKDAIAPLLDKYYAKASLVMVPSLYKTSIVYSERPLTTDGQLAFTRSNDTATRVGPDGYIEKVRTNLQIYSQDFRNIAEGGATNTWTPNDTIILSTNNTAPDGTLSATRIRGTSGGNKARQAVIFGTAGAPYSGSIYIRRVSGTTSITLRVGDVAQGISVNPTSAWQRFTSAVSPTSTAVRLAVVFTNDTDEFEIWGAQLETGDIATDYIPTTASAVSVGPVANLPRLNYPINSDGSVGCPSLLLEPQRTNSLTFSEQLDNAAWSKDGATISANSTTSPDGFVNADKVVENTANAEHTIFRSVVGSGATFSFFAKAAGRNFVAVLSNNGAYSFFNIGNGTLGTIAATSTATITAYGNGWYRCTLYNTHPTYGAVVNLASANGTTIYTGDGTSGAFIWGCQFEASAAYATSYIPTLGASVTRGADACSKTGISSLIGQTQGTLFVDFVPTAEAGSTSTSVNGGSTASRVQIFYAGSTIFSQVRVAGVTQFGPSVGGLVAGVRVKAALAYKANDFAFYVNGVQVGVGTTGTVPACSVFSFDSGSTGGALVASVNQALLFKTRLTNQELQDLTTL